MGDWRQITLGDVFSFANGKTSPERSSGLRNPVYGSNGIIGFADDFNAPENTIVIGRVGSFCGSLYLSKEKCWVTDNAIRARALNDNNTKFLFYLLSTLDLNHWRAGSGQPLLNQTILSQIPASIPLADEQRAIANILGTLDDKIELNRRMNETLEAMARAIFKSWFVDFDPIRAKLALSGAEGTEGRKPFGMDAATAALFPDFFQDSPLGKIPKGWSASELGDICEITDCLHSKKPERRDQGNPLLQLWNIRDDGLLDLSDTFWISEEDYALWTSRIEASPGDCVITNVGRVGAVSQISFGVKAALGRNMTAIRPKVSHPFPTFLIECLLSSAMRSEIELKIDSGTILDSLNVRNIPRLRLVLPPTNLLERFELLCRPLRRRMEANHEESHTLAAIRDALLPKLISGEIRVVDEQKTAKVWL